MQAHTPEEFQRRVDTALAGLPRVFAVHDDLIVRGKRNTNKAAPKDHDENIHPLPQGCWEKGNKPNEDKLGYKYAYTLCPGHVISKTNPKKTDVIKQLQQPKDKGEIHCLLCMLDTLRNVLLTCRRSLHLFGSFDREEKAISLRIQTTRYSIDNSKRRMWELPVLWYFDPKVERTTLQCDTSG